MRSVLSSHYVHGILFIVLILVGMSAYQRYSIAVEMENRRETVELEADALREREAALDAEVRYLSDDRGVEAELRRQFDVAREGEQVVVIVDSVPETPIQPLSTSSNDVPAWYEFWR